MSRQRPGTSRPPLSEDEAQTLRESLGAITSLLSTRDIGGRGSASSSRTDGADGGSRVDVVEDRAGSSSGSGRQWRI